MSEFDDGLPRQINSKEEFEGNWCGCCIDEIYRNACPFEIEHIAKVQPSENHTILYKVPVNIEEDTPPTSAQGPTKWDSQHVRLPCSNKSHYPVTAEDGGITIENRWEMIQKALLRPIKNSKELENAILSYNTKYVGNWNFRSLHTLFAEELDEIETDAFFNDLLPRIIRLALRLPELVQAPIPLLKQRQCHTISLTQQQISCLLANAFLCTFPRRNTTKAKSEYCSFPNINFNQLFQATGAAVIEKIKCICHYFQRVCPKEDDRSYVPSGCVTFERRYIPKDKLPNWSECTKSLGSTLLHITCDGTIEDDGYGLLQVDFANKYLGGGILGYGCVQEEIRFAICPELIVSKLFTESLKASEALIMVGCERFSNYTGYANTFQWHSNHYDFTPLDSSKRRLTHIVAIDALAFTQSSHQYHEELMLRELNKAYVGFYHPLSTVPPGIASGNWGCGAFGGNAHLKALLQLMACTINDRSLVYFTFGNKTLRDHLHRMHLFLTEHNVLVKDLWHVLKKYHPKNYEEMELYKFIYDELSTLKHAVNQSPANSKPSEKSLPLDTMQAKENPIAVSNISDNSDREVTWTSTTSEEIKTSSTEASGSTGEITKAKPRQRTILEMLNEPISKKPCPKKSPSNSPSKSK